MPTKIAAGVTTHSCLQQFAALLAKLAKQGTKANTELLFIFSENNSALSVQKAIENFIDATDGNVYLELVFTP